MQANGQNIDVTVDGAPAGGTPLTVALGTPIDFSGALQDDGTTTADNQEIYVLPFAGASDAIADLSFSNTASFGSYYTVSGTYNSGEDIAVPLGATTIVAGDSADFSTPFSSNDLVTTAVPEPTSMTFLGAGVIAAGLCMRRKNPVSVQS